MTKNHSLAILPEWLRAQRLSLLGIASLVLLALVVDRYTPIDRMLSDLFYDANTHGFPLRGAWFWSTLLHDGAKQLSAAFSFALLTIWLLLFARRTKKHLRSFTAFTLVAALACTFAVPAVKRLSAHSCPWSLQRYGGKAEFFRIGDPVPQHPGPGRCMPAGHASSAFMWIGAIYASRRWWPKRRNAALTIVAALGTVATVVQIVRGAHFLSHALLTAALCWTICWTFDCLCELRYARRVAPTIPFAGTSP